MKPPARHKPQQADRESPLMRRVLLVDDEAAILFAYRRLIEREGVGVDSCASIESAVAMPTAGNYQVVIADLRLSGTDNQDGMELLSFIRDLHPRTRVILVTGYGSPRIREAALSLGAAHYFEKPVLPAVILAALMELLGPAAEPVGVVLS